MQRASRLSTGGAIEAGPGIAVADHLDHLRSALPSGLTPSMKPFFGAIYVKMRMDNPLTSVNVTVPSLESFALTPPRKRHAM
jgi:hypothetical protein